MAFEITERARNAANAIVKQPSIVLIIDGIDTKFGSAVILKLIRYGDTDLEYGDAGVVYGGSVALLEQESILSIDGSTNSIKQQLDIDKGRGSSISSMEIALVDVDKVATELITPGFYVDDVLGRKAKILLSFADNTTFPEDYITIFRGIVDDIKAEQGLVKLNIAHPDQKKRASIFTSKETALDGALNNSDTVITVESTTQFLTAITGPDLTIDPSFSSYIRIDDEIILYTGVTPTTFTGCTRGALGTLADSHDDEATVTSFYRLEGNCIDLALKLMLSGWNDYFVDMVPVQNFNRLGDNTFIQDSIFFEGIDIEEDYGVVVGDFITTTGAANGANNVTLMEIGNVQKTNEGSYIEVLGVSFVEELDSAATIAFRSQYDTLPSGLMMSGDEVDIAEHLSIQRLFLSSFDMDFYLKETIENGKDFIELELYKPSGAYSLPRKARASLGYFVAPIPGSITPTLSTDNVTNPDKLKIRRTINKNFFNTIVYKYEVDPLEDKFLRGTITQSATSLTQIPVGSRALVIEASGMRQGLSGQNNAVLVSNRRLDRFKFAAEFMESLDLLYRDGFNIEIGDILVLDGTGLNLANTTDGTRDKPPQLFEISNITKNFKTGKITLDLIDTGFDGSARYSLIGPSSFIKTGISASQFVIEQSFNSPFGTNEYKKFQRYGLIPVKVRSSDFTTRYAETVITSYVGNTITVSPALGFTPQPGDVMELAPYTSYDPTSVVLLRYGFMSPLNGGADQPYQMI